MDTLLRLNLQSPEKTNETANLPKNEKEEPKPFTVGKRINRLANKAAHRAARDSARGRGGIFSK